MEPPLKESLPKLTFVLGGSRSGKSRFAQTLAEGNRSVTFWATGSVCDGEMKKRIENHRLSRPENWKLIEEPQDLLGGLRRFKKSPTELVLLDSLTTWAGNLFGKPGAYGKYLEDLYLFLAALTKASGRWIIVSDEVGMSVVPGTRSGRIFRDFLGDANQRVAAVASQVYWVSAGIPNKIK